MILVAVKCWLGIKNYFHTYECNNCTNCVNISYNSWNESERRGEDDGFSFGNVSLFYFKFIRIAHSGGPFILEMGTIPNKIITFAEKLREGNEGCTAELQILHLMKQCCTISSLLDY